MRKFFISPYIHDGDFEDIRAVIRVLKDRLYLEFPVLRLTLQDIKYLLNLLNKIKEFDCGFVIDHNSSVPVVRFVFYKEVKK